MSRQSFIPTLKYAVYVVIAFLLFTLFASWKESGTSGDASFDLLQKTRANHDFILTFTTLVMVPLMWRYFFVMSEMRRLEQSDIALKRQAQQASNMVSTLMDENSKLKETSKKWEELSLEKVTMSPSSQGLGVEGSNSVSLMGQNVMLEQRNKDLERELEE